MSRIVPLDPPYDADVQASFDLVMRGASPLILFRTVATSDRAWRKFRGGSLLDKGPLSLRERELVIDRTCALTGCEYEWGVHASAFGAAASLSDDELACTVHGGSRATIWTAAEQVLLATVEALHANATLDLAEFEALAAHYRSDQILEIMMLCGFYRMVAYVSNGLALPLEPGAARFPPAPAAAA
ncbi:carboxymuconolactone decarboxylase family protein [Phenylobacterium sp.]|jgi:alkylhydroperoxidase family enzyme|uniref:carboxymuconolactone decarboxylase family protein n=1 Tax=Phenylobacterium sp. TaxID=1871053 RepID=UPI0037C7E51D